MDGRILYVGSLVAVFVTILLFFLFQPKQSTIPPTPSENLSLWNANKTTEYFNLILDKKQYNLGEPITFTFKTNSDAVYLCDRWEGYSRWRIEGFDRGVWTRINIVPTDSSLCDCVNISVGNSTVERLECTEVEPPYLIKTRQNTFVWDQKIHRTTRAQCGGEVYPSDIEEQVPPGKYTVRFCYYYNPLNITHCYGETTCSEEKGFEIVPSGETPDADDSSYNLTMKLDPDGQMWVEIDPVDCLENPWEVDWLESHNNDRTAYPLGNATKIEQSEMEIIQSYYQKLGIEISNIKSEKIYDAMYGGCGLPQGHVLYLLVPNSDILKMLELGYKISDVQS